MKKRMYKRDRKIKKKRGRKTEKANRERDRRDQRHPAKKNGHAQN